MLIWSVLNLREACECFDWYRGLPLVLVLGIELKASFLYVLAGNYTSSCLLLRKFRVSCDNLKKKVGCFLTARTRVKVTSNACVDLVEKTFTLNFQCLSVLRLTQISALNWHGYSQSELLVPGIWYPLVVSTGTDCVHIVKATLRVVNSIQLLFGWNCFVNRIHQTTHYLFLLNLVFIRRCYFPETFPPTD